jgi:hypothetical protein
MARSIFDTPTVIDRVAETNIEKLLIFVKVDSLRLYQISCAANTVYNKTNNE